jgi:hypothetical protein
VHFVPFRIAFQNRRHTCHSQWREACWQYEAAVGQLQLLRVVQSLASIISISIIFEDTVFGCKILQLANRGESRPVHIAGMPWSALMRTSEIHPRHICPIKRSVVSFGELPQRENDEIQGGFMTAWIHILPSLSSSENIIRDLCLIHSLCTRLL